MLDVEQFVYTTASIDGSKGYQIVAKSVGITTKILDQLEGYFYPVGIDSSEFNESRSMIVLDDDLIVYSKIKNIGIGYDGRDNTLYNHSFVFSKQNFEDYDYDSRIFDKFFIGNQSIQGILPTLTLDPPVPIPAIDFTISKFVLDEILFSLFMNKKIALIFEDNTLPQKILSLLPKSMRLISFSTSVTDSTKQSKYNFILGKKIKKYTLEENYQIISKNISPKPHNRTQFEKSISYYAEMIMSHQYDKLSEINTSFDNLSSKSLKNKLILLCNYLQFQNSEGDEKSQYAENILKVLKKFDGDTFSTYFEKIKSSLKQYELLERKLKPTFNPYMSFIDACFFLPAKMVSQLFGSFIPSEENDGED